MAAVVAMRNDRAIPLFEYIIRNVNWKGPLRDVYDDALADLQVGQLDRLAALLDGRLRRDLQSGGRLILQLDGDRLGRDFGD